MRDDDLRSVNFFDIDRHPDMTFESTGLTVHDGLLELPGKLTIRSITRDVALEVEFLGLDETGLQSEQRIARHRDCFPSYGRALSRSLTRAIRHDRASSGPVATARFAAT